MVIRPKERQAQIQHQVEQDLAKRKEKDQKWEDYVDVRTLIAVCTAVAYIGLLSTEPVPASSSALCVQAVQVLCVESIVVFIRVVCEFE